jgi:hypothetical protein
MPEIAANLDVLAPLHLDHTTRYPNDRRVPELEQFAVSTADAVIDAVSLLIMKP